tara:strand:+ start:784 stop:969 length:186 start_codon:yes stop_codon:yes gene_type:complete
MNTEVLILEAQEVACTYYNIPRQQFVEIAAHLYPGSGIGKACFIAAVRAYDEIQEDMKEIA